MRVGAVPAGAARVTVLQWQTGGVCTLITENAPAWRCSGDARRACAIEVWLF
jgi:hypothetical protein